MRVTHPKNSIDLDLPRDSIHKHVAFFTEVFAAKRKDGEGHEQKISTKIIQTSIRLFSHSPGQIFAMFFYASLPRRNVWCAAIFGGAALTDWFDGYIARTRGLETPFGAFLDPVADKVRTLIH